MPPPGAPRTVSNKEASPVRAPIGNSFSRFDALRFGADHGPLKRKGNAMMKLFAPDVIGIALWFAVLGFSAAVIADVFVR